VLYGIAYPRSTPHGGDARTEAFTAAVLGGIGSIRGAVLGALIMGQSETMTTAYLSSTYRDGIRLRPPHRPCCCGADGDLGKARTEKV